MSCVDMFSFSLRGEGIRSLLLTLKNRNFLPHFRHFQNVSGRLYFSYEMRGKRNIYLKPSAHQQNTKKVIPLLKYGVESSFLGQHLKRETKNNQGEAVLPSNV